MSGETEHFDFTRYGFEWGAAKFERLASIDGRVVLRVSAGKRHVDIYVSAAGRSIRVFDDKNDELTTNPSPPEEGVRLTGEFVAKRNPDGEIEHHFNSEGDADVQFAATPEAIPLTGPVEILISPLSEGESNE